MGRSSEANLSTNVSVATSSSPIASKTKVMSALIPDEQHQAVLLDGEPLEDVDKFKYIGSMFVANGQGTEETRSRINLARSAFSRLQSCLWSRREISLRTKGTVYQVVVRSILLYGCETWPVRVADERKLEVFDDDSIHHTLRVRHRVCHPWNCVTASALHAYRHCSYKEGSAGLVMPQDVPKVS